jgi:hypothetical protein
MRSKQELDSYEFQDDMSELEAELRKRNIDYTIDKHLGAKEGDRYIQQKPQCGEWHIFVGDVSIIKGMVSFGDYEAYGGKYKEPVRFQSAKALVKDLIKK